MTEIAAAVPPEVVQNYPHWDCEFHGNYQKVTVGAIWQMTCNGDTELKPPLSLQFPDEKMDFSLAILKTQKSGRSLEMEVTGYKPGAFAPAYVVLTDGNNAVRVDGLKWEITSVLPPGGQAPQQAPVESGAAATGPQPFAPYGPYKLDLPLWFWLAIGGAGVAILLVGWIFWMWRRRQRREREALKILDNTLTPAIEMYRDLRQCMRQVGEPLKMVGPLSRALRVYLSRKYRFVALDMSRPAIGRRLKKWLKAQDRQRVSELLRELDRSLTEPARVTVQDAEQLVQLARALVDHLEKPR